MNIHFSLTSLIDILGLAQGVLFGLLLVFSADQKRPSLFLGLFLLTYSLELCGSLLSDTKLVDTYSSLRFLPFRFYFLSLPLLYCYTLSLISDKLPRHFWVHLLAGFVEFLFFLFVFLSPKSVQDIFENEFLNTWKSMAYWLCGLGFSFAYAVLIYLRIRKHQGLVYENFSEVRDKRLRWLQRIVIFLAVFSLSWMLFDFLPPQFAEQVGYPVFSAINVIFIYWVGLTGMRQPKVPMPQAASTELLPIIENINEKTVEIVENPAKTEPESYQTLLQWMENEKPYNNPELTLNDLAQQLQLPPKQLSQTINQGAGMNFNRFINQYRVEAAKELLNDPKFLHFSAEGIGYEVGFNSKASFYAVFKDFAGLSPAAWRKGK